MPLFLLRLKEEEVSGSLMAAERLAMLFGAVRRRPMTVVLLVHIPGMASQLWELQLSLAEGRSRALQLGHALLSLILSRIYTSKTWAVSLHCHRKPGTKYTNLLGRQLFFCVQSSPGSPLLLVHHSGRLKLYLDALSQDRADSYLFCLVELE